MSLKGILAISGQSGLFKILSEGKSSVIVESLLNGKRSTVYTNAKMSALEDIAIYTTGEDVPLKQVLKKIAEKEQNGPAIDSKKPQEEVREYFSEILPEYDKERVYFSDIKKVISWYNLLQEKGLLNFEEEEKKEEETNEIKPETES
jgi:Ribonuclease G/E